MTYESMAPCLLPQLSLLKQVREAPSFFDSLLGSSPCSEHFGQLTQFVFYECPNRMKGFES